MNPAALRARANGHRHTALIIAVQNLRPSRELPMPVEEVRWLYYWITHFTNRARRLDQRASDIELGKYPRQKQRKAA